MCQMFVLGIFKCLYSFVKHLLLCAKQLVKHLSSYVKHSCKLCPENNLYDDLDSRPIAIRSSFLNWRDIQVLEIFKHKECMVLSLLACTSKKRQLIWVKFSVLIIFKLSASLNCINIYISDLSIWPLERIITISIGR